jgi:hypothetical protein
MNSGSLQVGRNFHSVSILDLVSNIAQYSEAEAMVRELESTQKKPSTNQQTVPS